MALATHCVHKLPDASEHNPAIYGGGATKAGVDASLLPPAPEEPERGDPAPGQDTPSPK
jgi:hypothetical protein